MPYHTVSSGEPATIDRSEAKSHPEFSQAHEDFKQRLETDYSIQKRYTATTIDPFAERVVTSMEMAKFLNTHSTHDGSDDPTSTDLNFSLRNFLVASPADDPNALFARIAVKEGRVFPGYIPNLPQRTVSESEARQSFTTHPRLSHAHMDMWTLKQGLERNYYDMLEAHPAETVDPFAELAVEEISTTGPTKAPMGNPDSTSMDLDFSLRNFVNTSPADDPNALFARIAMKEGSYGEGKNTDAHVDSEKETCANL